MINYIEKYTTSLYCILGSLAFLIFSLQRIAGFSFKIGTATPVLLLPFVVIVACFLREWSGFWFGLFSGIALDTVTNGTTFLNTLLFILIGTSAGLIFRFILNRNLKSVLLALLGYSFIYFLIKWFFLSVLPKDPSAGELFLRYHLTSAIYTTLFAIPFFYLIKWLANRHLIQKS